MTTRTIHTQLSHPRHRGQVRAPGGFTVVELLIALALASILVTAAWGVLWVLIDADGRSDVQQRRRTELSTTQTVVRRAMAGLTAATPKEEEPVAQAGVSDEEAPPEGEPAEGEAPAEEEDPELASLPERRKAQTPEDQLRDLVLSVTSDAALADRLSRDPFERPTFQMSADPQSRAGAAWPRLEVMLYDAPVPPPPSGPLTPQDRRELRAAPAPSAVESLGLVRGAFEVFEGPSGAELVWRPIDPPAEPTVLLSGLARIEWWCLPRSIHGTDWMAGWSAYLQEDYPVAVRLVVWSLEGDHWDWLFDVSVSTPGGRER